MDSFLNQLIQFTRITQQQIFTTKLHTVRRVAPRHVDRIRTTDYCDITSP